MRKAHAGRVSDLQAKGRRPVELCILSAQALKNVKSLGRMKTYAVAYIHPSHKISTRVDADGGSNPTWDEKMKLWVEEDRLENESAQLTIEIYSHGALRDKLIGTVRIFLADAMKKTTGIRGANNFPVTPYLIFRPSGGAQGILNVCIPPAGIFTHRQEPAASDLQLDQTLPSSVEDFSSDSEEDAAPNSRLKFFPPPPPHKNHPITGSTKV